MWNLQEQVKKAFCYLNFSDLSLFEKIVLEISKFLQILGLQPQKKFSITRTFFSYSRSEQYGNKISLLDRNPWDMVCIFVQLNMVGVNKGKTLQFQICLENDMVDTSWLRKIVNGHFNPLNEAVQCTEVRFASFLSGGFTTMVVINPPERKPAKRTFVHCSGLISYHFLIFFSGSTN